MQRHILLPALLALGLTGAAQAGTGTILGGALGGGAGAAVGESVGGRNGAIIGGALGGAGGAAIGNDYDRNKEAREYRHHGKKYKKRRHYHD